MRVAREHVLKRIENHEFSKVIFGSNLANTEELEAHGYTIEEPVPGLKPAETSEQEEKWISLTRKISWKKQSKN